MRKIETKLSGMCIVEPDVHGNQRGYFMETVFIILLLQSLKS